MKVALLTTHLLGTGHLSRALALGAGFAAKGHEICVFSGGRPAPHLAKEDVPLIQLPPVRSDGLQFTRLLDHEDQPVDDAYLVARRALVLTQLERLEPDVLITELYPFGRRVLRQEFDAVLEHQKSRHLAPPILASVRDILAPPSSAARAAWTEERLRAAYDGVLVHADNKVVELGDSWPVTPQLAAKLHYTGFVAPALPKASKIGPGRDEILVSAGGGPVGQALFEAAIQAACMSDGAPQIGPMRLLVGGDPARREALTALAAPCPWITVEGPRPDYREMLQRAALSISQAGYNTVLDVALAGTPAILVPFAEGGETEQRDRAKAYAARLGFEVLDEATLTAETLLDAIRRIKATPRTVYPTLNVAGAHQSVAITEKLLAASRG